ncbi:hypothetical protein ES705_26610 [subsurface metagenome]
MITYGPSYDCTNLPLAAFCAIYGLEGEEWQMECIDWVEWTHTRYYHQN